MQLTVTVRNRRASTDLPALVCGNGDYEAHFDLDSEWDAFPRKTACFAYRQSGREILREVHFTGDCCTVPVISGTDLVSVGLYAGGIRTTVPARIPCRESITAYAGEPYSGDIDVYHELMQQLAVTEGGYADCFCLLADRDGDLIAAADGSCIACRFCFLQ